MTEAATPDPAAAAQGRQRPGSGRHRLNQPDARPGLGVSEQDRGNGATTVGEAGALAEPGKATVQALGELD